METNTFDQLPPDWQEEVRKLRSQAANYRTQRNQLRSELEALRTSAGK
ncbi:Uncharacterised protein [Mycolicibacterium fortuitum]|uniref:Uncharacterized protein n=1 Tax=Mycolicibacterium fortuitum TaxID=1766 RepID=A0A378V361_MYCFO|nr:Uncharacterised protein [Mycolicibacterium fortuitum]